MFMKSFLLGGFLLAVAWAQIPPGQAEMREYDGLFAAVSRGDLALTETLLAAGSELEARDGNGRTPLLVAAHLSHDAVARALLEAGADPNALDRQRYDLVTIAAVNDDVAMIRLGLDYGADPAAVTSPYDGTALIAAAHLGHVETVRTLIAAGAPLDHVNNLGWTALIEAIVLGDGGERHTAVLQALIDAGADVDLADRSGRTPLTLAQARGYDAMVRMLDEAGARSYRTP